MTRKQTLINQFYGFSPIGRGHYEIEFRDRTGIHKGITTDSELYDQFNDRDSYESLPRSFWEHLKGLSKGGR